jgi:hypothetical protein
MKVHVRLHTARTRAPRAARADRPAPARAQPRDEISIVNIRVLDTTPSARE